jgi:hypothetical protein
MLRMRTCACVCVRVHAYACVPECLTIFRFTHDVHEAHFILAIPQMSNKDERINLMYYNVYMCACA